MNGQGQAAQEEHVPQTFRTPSGSFDVSVSHATQGGSMLAGGRMRDVGANDIRYLHFDNDSDRQTKQTAGTRYTSSNDNNSRACN